MLYKVVSIFEFPVCNIEVKAIEQYFHVKPFVPLILRVRFFKKIQDWIFKSEIIRKRILRFFTRQINPRSFGSWRVKGTEESTSSVDSSVPLTHHDLSQSNTHNYTWLTVRVKSTVQSMLSCYKIC